MPSFISCTAWILSLLALLSPAVRAAPGQEPAWRIQGGQAHAHLGSSIATADVNGDGFGDLVVGAPDHDGARIDEGRVLVFHGSPGGPATTPDWERRGFQARARFGARVARAGDVNGDGFDDVLISAPDWDVHANPANPFHVGAPGRERYTTDEGRVFLFLGSPAGLEDSPRFTVAGIERREHFGSAVAGVGDVNGDGFDDVAIGATGKAGGMGGVFFFAGTPSGELGWPSWIEIGTVTGTGLGSSIAAAGDTNGDGFDDFVIGLPEKVGNCGQIAFVGGSASGPLPVVPVNEGLLALGPAGDFDQDGQLEQVFLSDACQSGAPLRWRRLVNGPSGSLPGLAEPAVVAAGDLNGDGRLDIVTGAPDFAFGPFHGRVLVLMARPGEALGSMSAMPVFDGDQPGAGWGEALATADVDGDGAAELFIAAPRQDGAAPAEGAVTLIRGWPEDVAVDEVGDGFATEQSVGIGDFDADGFSDLALFNANPGSLEVRYGSPAGLPQAADAVLVLPPLDNERFFDFSTGDVNGDGFGDLQVSILPSFPYFTFDTTHCLYFGSSSGLLVNPASTWVRPGDSGTVREAEIVGDVNGDGFDDLFIANELHLGTAGLPVHSQNLPGLSVFASIAGTIPGRHRGVLPGDLDGDPYGDVIVARGNNNLELRVYRGSPAGLALQQTLFPARRAGGFFPVSFLTKVLALEDLDGDGLDDLVVAYGNSGTSGYELALFHGSSAGIQRVTQWWDYSVLPHVWMHELLAVVDVDGDGFHDILLEGNQLHRGSPDGILRTPAWIGWPLYDFALGRVDLAGDFDGDGRPEFANLFTSTFSPFLRLFELDAQ